MCHLSLLLSQGDETGEDNDQSEDSEDSDNTNSWISSELVYSDENEHSELHKATPQQIPSSPSSTSQAYPHRFPPNFTKPNCRTFPNATNTTTLGYNHHFPLTVHSMGLVSLEYPDPSMFKRQSEDSQHRRKG